MDIPNAFGLYITLTYLTLRLSFVLKKWDIWFKIIVMINNRLIDYANNDAYNEGDAGD